MKHLKNIKTHAGLSAGLKLYKAEEVPAGQEPKPSPNRKGRRALEALELKQNKQLAKVVAALTGAGM